MANPIVHFELMGPDGGAQKDFYSKIFDWNLEGVEGFENYYMVHTGEGELGGAVGQGNENMPQYATIYVQVDSIDESLGRIGELGGQTLVPRTEIPDVVTFALFADLAGNMVGLVEEE